jgi:hypothetical protein
MSDTTGWTFDTDAAVVYDPVNAYWGGALARQQGYVAKVAGTGGASTAGVYSPITTTYFTIGATMQASAYAMVSGTYADGGAGLTIKISALNAVGGVLASQTATTTATSYTLVTTTALTVPAGTVKIQVSAYTVNQTAGTAFIGTFGILSAGKLVRFYDFSDSTQWTTDAGASVVLDTATAYLGNSYNGTGSYTLELQPESIDLEAEPIGDNFPVTAGEIFRVQSWGQRLNMSASFTGVIGLEWLNASGSVISRAGASWASTDTGWVQKSADVTAPALAVTARVRSWTDGGASDGIFMVGAQPRVDKVIGGSLVPTTQIQLNAYWDSAFATQEFGTLVPVAQIS